MKSIWKWVLAIAGVLLVVGCLGIAAIFIFAGRGLQFGRGIPLMPMMPYYRGFGQGPDPRFGYGILPGLGGWLVRLVIPLALLALVVLVVVGIILALRRRPPAPVPPAPVAPVIPATSPCPHCGQQVQAGWVACPYCGEKLSST
jgi:hypothetical protein